MSNFRTLFNIPDLASMHTTRRDGDTSLC